MQQVWLISHLLLLYLIDLKTNPVLFEYCREIRIKCSQWTACGSAGRTGACPGNSSYHLHLSACVHRVSFKLSAEQSPPETNLGFGGVCVCSEAVGLILTGRAEIRLPFQFKSFISRNLRTSKERLWLTSRFHFCFHQKQAVFAFIKAYETCFKWMIMIGDLTLSVHSQLENVRKPSENQHMPLKPLLLSVLSFSIVLVSHSHTLQGLPLSRL